MLLRDATGPFLEDLDFAITQSQLDFSILMSVLLCRYLHERVSVQKLGNIHLAWEYAQDPAHHHRFVNMLQVSPDVFRALVD